MILLRTALFALFVTHASALFAQTSESTQQASSFHYPELLVTPSASQRLLEEEKHESQNRFRDLWPLQVSGLTTLLAGASALGEKKDGEIADAHYAGLAAISIGGAWLGTSAILAMTYTPYRDGVARIKKFGGTTKQQQLGRERLAEEALQEPAALAVRLRWMSVFTNAAASLAVAGASKDRMTQAAGGVSALVALAPWLFPLRWEKTWNYHDEYKRKVFGPITSGGLIWDPTSRTYVPGLMLSMSI